MTHLEQAGLLALLREIEPVFAHLCKDSNEVRPETYELWGTIKLVIMELEGARMLPASLRQT